MSGTRKPSRRAIARAIELAVLKLTDTQCVRVALASEGAYERSQRTNEDAPLSVAEAAQATAFRDTLLRVFSEGA
jgi:capsid portal protein